MKFIFKIIIFLIFFSNFAYGKQTIKKLEEKAIKYYSKADFNNYFKTILKIIRKYPDSDISKLYLISLKIDKPLFKNYSDLIKLKLNILHKYKNDIFVYHILQTDIMNYYLSKQDFTRAESILKKSGILSKWRYTNPFIETYYNDINKNFFNIEKNIPNINNWNKFNKKSDWGWVPIQEIIYPQNGTIYASCNLYIKKDTDIIIWFISDASSKFFINKQLIFKNDMRNNGELNSIYTIHLNKGWNNFLLKLFNYSSSFDFKFKLLNQDGTPFTNYKISLNTQYNINKNEILYKKYSPEIYTGLKAKILSGSKNLIDYYHYGLLEFIFFNTSQSIEALVRAKDLQKKYNFLTSFLLGRIYFYLYTQNKNNTLLNKSFEEFNNVLKLTPHFIRAKEYLVKFYFRKKRFNKAIEILKSIKKNYNIIKNLYSRYFENIGWEYMKNNFSEQAYKLNKNYYTYLYSTLKFYNNYSNKNSILTNVLNIKYSKNFAKLFIENLYNSDSTNFLKALNIYHLLNPFDNFYNEKLADYYINKKNYNKAINILNKTNNPYILERIGNIYELKGDKKKSIYYYEKSLNKYPADFKLAEKINYLKTKNFFLNMGKKYLNFINSKNIIKEAINDNKNYNSDIKYYLDSMTIKINTDGTYKYLIHRIYKILSIDGKNDNGEIQIDYANYISYVKVINYLSVKEKYEAVEKRKYNNSLFLSVPKLKIGSVVEVLYEVNNKYPRLDNTEYFYGYPFIFQNNYAPVQNSAYVVIVPKNFNLKYDFRNNTDIDIDFDIIQDNKNKIYIWKSSEEINKLELEQKSVSIYDIVPNVYVSTIPDLKTIFKWYNGKLIGKNNIGWKLQKKAYEFYQSANNTNGFSVIQFLKNLYYYIQKEFIHTENYLFYPENINDTFYKHKANAEQKVFLFKSILKSFNIKSDVFLVRNKNFSKFRISTPVPYAFKDIIIYVPKQYNLKNNIYIDFSDKFIPFSYIKDSINYTQGYNIRTYKKNKIKNLKANEIIEHYNIIVSNENYMNITGDIEYIGTKNLIKKFFANSFDRENKTISMINNFIPDISIKTYKLLNFDKLEKNLILKFYGKKEIITKKDFIIDKFKLSEKYIFAKERKYPLHIYSPINKKIITTVKNYNLKTEKITIKNKFGSYKYICENNKIIRELKIDIQTVRNSDYKEFLNFCKRIDNIEN